MERYQNIVMHSTGYFLAPSSGFPMLMLPSIFCINHIEIVMEKPDIPSLDFQCQHAEHGTVFPNVMTIAH